MINAILVLFDTIKSILIFFIHSLESLIRLFLSIPSYTIYLINLIANVPNVFIPFLTASISIYVIYLVTGRSRDA